MPVIDNTNRWYDQNPTVSLAISIFRNENKASQKAVADFLLKNIFKDNPHKHNIKKPPFFKRRWYDYNESVYKVIELMKLSDDETQNTVALEIINYLYSLKN